jgi:hypothetical protein
LNVARENNCVDIDIRRQYMEFLAGMFAGMGLLIIVSWADSIGKK